MNTLGKRFTTGMLALSLMGGAVVAQADEGRHGTAVQKEQRQAKMAERFQAHMAKMHDKLKLAPEQEAAWTAYVAAVTPAATAGNMEHGAMAGMPAPERMEQMLTMARKHITMMEAHLAALKTFYAQLTPEQKKVFDDSSLGGAHGPHMAMQMMHH